MNIQTKITPSTVSLAQLKPGQDYPGANLNARTTGRDQDIDALAASIKSEGVLQSLLVCPGPAGDKSLYVIAGNRRLAALRKLKWDGEIPVIVRDDVTPGSALAMSLAENVTQCPLHPVDRFEAFAALIASGQTEADIAANYSVSDRVVKQSLALGRLAPKVRQAWREGKIEAGVAKAFTVSTDIDAQTKIFDKLKAKGWLHQASFVREELVGDQSDTRRFLTYVGRAAYEAAGGKVQEDLFAVQSGRRATDAEEDEDASDTPLVVGDFPLLVRLAGEKLKAKCDELVKGGWNWAADADDLPDNALYSYGGWKQIEKASAKSSADVKAKYGVALKLKHDGTLEITYGLLKPGSKALPAKVSAKDEKAMKKTSNALSNALKDRLIEQLTHATQDALKAQADGKMLGHLLARIVSSQIRPGLPSRSPHQVGEALSQIRERLPAKEFNAALAKRFDAKAYFMGSPKSLVVRAITEMGFTDDAKKLAGGTKAAAWKWAIPHHKGTGWLPAELRTVHYVGPGSKKKGR